ncbi:MAG: undecaprenyl-diphosphate phosphatase [Bacteroidales bacterium]|jgi:undecaprenyl-diphosphatase|nr:undecaprenyl-diphosphate phosphatase [Bacteroidales bacterium]
MSLIEAIILGIIQGLTEFLPVSSSGHLEIGKALLNVQLEEDLGFTVIVHLATVLSTITVFYKEIKNLSVGILKFKWNSEMKYGLKIIIAALPVLVVGLFFKDEVESLFTHNKDVMDGSGRQYNLVLVGSALLLTATLLGVTSFIKPGQKKRIPYLDTFIMGIAQAFAVIPGLSRSGSTIAAGLLMKNNREEVAQFSFLMVLIPILGASGLMILDWIEAGTTSTGILQLSAGFITAYVSGFIACKWMINIVKKGKLIWFAIYCAVIGVISILFSI